MSQFVSILLLMSESWHHMSQSEKILCQFKFEVTTLTHFEEEKTALFTAKAWSCELLIGENLSSGLPHVGNLLFILQIHFLSIIVHDAVLNLHYFYIHALHYSNVIFCGLSLFYYS